MADLLAIFDRMSGAAAQPLVDRLRVRFGRRRASRAESAHESPSRYRRSTMRAGIRRELFARFGDMMAGHLPRFQHALVAGGDRNVAVWRRPLAADLFLFVMLQAFETADEFAIELGWSDSPDFPWADWSFKFQEVTARRGRERLSQLWVTDGRDVPWAVVRPETSAERGERLRAGATGDVDAVRQMIGARAIPVPEAVARVPRLVDDARDKLLTYGVPLFRCLADARGITWPIS